MTSMTVTYRLVDCDEHKQPLPGAMMQEWSYPVDDLEDALANTDDGFALLGEITPNEQYFASLTITNPGFDAHPTILGRMELPGMIDEAGSDQGLSFRVACVDSVFADPFNQVHQYVTSVGTMYPTLKDAVESVREWFNCADFPVEYKEDDCAHVSVTIVAPRGNLAPSHG